MLNFFVFSFQQLLLFSMYAYRRRQCLLFATNGICVWVFMIKMTRDYERKKGRGQGISAEVTKRAVREINNGESTRKVSNAHGLTVRHSEGILLSMKAIQIQ